jgi:hypothetical protein
MFEKIVLIFIILIILFFIYLKIWYRFWTSQPVFNTFNLFQWIKPSGIIHHSIGEKYLKFYNPKIITNNYQEIPTEKKALIYYFSSPNLSKNQYLSQYSNSINKIYVSTQYDITATPLSNLDNAYSKKLTQYMITKTVNSHINNKKFLVSFIQLFYTHYYNTRKMNCPPIFLFKSEKKLPYLVPCTTFHNVYFDTKYLDILNTKIPNNLSIHLINPQNFDLFYHFIGEINSNFTFFTIPDSQNFKSMISNNLIKPVLLLDETKVVGGMILKLTKNTISLIGSYYFPKYIDFMLESLQNSLYLLKKNHLFKTLVIKNISHNDQILKKILVRKSPLKNTADYLYFFNFAIKPFKSNNCLVIY